jgi:hypothetical protein
VNDPANLVGNIVIQPAEPVIARMPSGNPRFLGEVGSLPRPPFQSRRDAGRHHLRGHRQQLAENGSSPRPRRTGSGDGNCPRPGIIPCVPVSFAWRRGILGTSRTDRLERSWWESCPEQGRVPPCTDTACRRPSRASRASEVPSAGIATSSATRRRFSLESRRDSFHRCVCRHDLSAGSLSFN